MTKQRKSSRPAEISRGPRGRRHKISSAAQEAVTRLITAFEESKETQEHLEHLGLILRSQEEPYLLRDDKFSISALGPLYTEAALNGTSSPGDAIPKGVTIDSLPVTADEVEAAWLRLEFYWYVGSASCHFVPYWLYSPDGKQCVIVECTPGMYGPPWPPEWIGPFKNSKEFTQRLGQSGWWVFRDAWMFETDTEFIRIPRKTIQEYLSEVKGLLSRADRDAEPWTPRTSVSEGLWIVHADQMSAVHEGE